MTEIDTAYQSVDLPRQAGIYVRRTREDKGFTRAQLAQMAGVSERLLASLELGDAPGIRLDKLLAVLNALGLSLMVQGVPETNGSKTSFPAGEGGVLKNASEKRVSPIRKPRATTDWAQGQDLMDAYNAALNDIVEGVISTGEGR